MPTTLHSPVYPNTTTGKICNLHISTNEYLDNPWTECMSFCAMHQTNISLAFKMSNQHRANFLPPNDSTNQAYAFFYWGMHCQWKAIPLFPNCCNGIRVICQHEQGNICFVQSCSNFTNSIRKTFHVLVILYISLANPLTIFARLDQLKTTKATKRKKS